MKKTLKKIAEALGGTVEGDGGRVITGIAGVQEAGPEDLSFIADAKYAVLARSSGAGALIVDRNLEIDGFDLIRVEDPARAWNKILDWIKPAPLGFAPGIHSGAQVSGDAVLGKDVTVMANATIQPGAMIGDRTLVYPGVYVGHEARVGKDCVLYPNAVIRERVVLGDRVLVHGGAVIGADGFGYVPEGGRLVKQEQFGTVVIEEDVEIGANTTIDRARFGVTRLCKGTKVDNLVQIAHNVMVGEHCILLSQVGISGSTRLGKNVQVAGQVGVVGHVTVGDNARLASKAGVTKNVPQDTTVFGIPAREIRQMKREIANVRRIPKLVDALEKLSERVKRLEAQSENHQEPR